MTEQANIIKVSNKVVAKTAGKEEAMKNERIVSLGTTSMIYHKPGCRYVERIKYKNRMSLTKGDARDEGYHICRYCNNMNHHIKAEESTLDYYERCKKMQFKYINGILYVKSEIGCWKLVYVRREEKIALYHRNATTKELDFEHPQFEAYHRQEDKLFCNSIEGCLDYIYEHDKYKAAIERGETVTRFSSKKYARREAKAQRKRQNKRLDYLFKVIEGQNTGLKNISYC